MSDKITPEQLRKEAVAVERMHGETLTVDWRTKQANQLRAHADALEENARLTKRADDAHSAIKTLTQIVFEWKGRAERAEAELAKLRQKLMRYEHAEAADILHPPQDEQARAANPKEDA